MLRTAIVGLGWWGQVMVDAVHGRDAPLRFTHAFVRNPEPVREFAEARGLQLLDSLDAVLTHPDIHAVVLATPHTLHVEQIVACAAAGRAVFSEKPLALSLRDAERAVRACLRAGVVLGLGTDRRRLPAMQRLHTLVVTGSLGELMHLEGHYANDTMTRGLSGGWRSSTDQAPGAGMTGPGLHMLDALIHLAGPVAEVRGQLIRPLGADVPVDALSLLLRFGSGATGTLGCVRGVPDCFRVTVFGTRGWAELRQFGELELHVTGERATTESHSPELAVGELLDCFADAAEGRADFPVSTLSMLQTVAAFEAALMAFDQPSPVRVAALSLLNEGGA